MNPLTTLAYIDPMSGAVVLQLIIAFIAGVGAFFRHTIIGGIKRIFGFGRQQDASS
ncbi:MAG: hypothetical protein AAF456_08060 [Planctomycetota bacterium]